MTIEYLIALIIYAVVVGSICALTIIIDCRKMRRHKKDLKAKFEEMKKEAYSNANSLIQQKEVKNDTP